MCLQKVWYSCCRDECYSRNPRDKEDKKSAGKHKTVLNTTNPNNKKATRFRITLGQEMRCTYFTNVKHHMGYSHNWHWIQYDMHLRQASDSKHNNRSTCPVPETAATLLKSNLASFILAKTTSIAYRWQHVQLSAANNISSQYPTKQSHKRVQLVWVKTLLLIASEVMYVKMHKFFH